MKTIKYFGLSLIVPDEAKFIATDPDGEIVWYIEKPKCHDDMWMPKRPNGNNTYGFSEGYVRFNMSRKKVRKQVEKKWRKSLVKVN